MNTPLYKVQSAKCYNGRWQKYETIESLADNSELFDFVWKMQRAVITKTRLRIMRNVDNQYYEFIKIEINPILK